MEIESFHMTDRRTLHLALNTPTVRRPDTYQHLICNNWRVKLRDPENLSGLLSTQKITVTGRGSYVSCGVQTGVRPPDFVSLPEHLLIFVEG